MNGCSVCTFAASSVFSLFGALYVGVPVAVLLGTAWLASRRSGRLFWTIVCGATGGIAGVVLMAVLSNGRPNGLLDRNLAVAVNAGACTGAVLGVALFTGLRIAARSLATRRSA